MTDLVKVSDGALAKAAHENYERIKVLKAKAAETFIELGWALKVARDEKHFKVLGYDTFEAFLGDPDISFSRAWVFGLIRVYEVYIERLKRPEDELVTISPSKLLEVARETSSGQPLVETNVDEWMGMAKALSSSDLKEEVNTALGKVKVEKGDEPKADLPIDPTCAGTDYVTFAKGHPCIVCGAKEVDLHHFPITKGAGGEHVRDWVIPLCRTCHTEYHENPKDWTWKWRGKWGAYFFNLIFVGMGYDDGAAGPGDGDVPEVIEGVEVDPPDPSRAVPEAASFSHCSSCGLIMPVKELNTEGCSQCAPGAKDLDTEEA